MARKAPAEGEQLERVVAYLPTSLRVWVEAQAAGRGTSFSGHVRQTFVAQRKRSEEKVA